MDVNLLVNAERGMAERSHSIEVDLHHNELDAEMAQNAKRDETKGKKQEEIEKAKKS